MELNQLRLDALKDEVLAILDDPETADDSALAEAIAKWCSDKLDGKFTPPDTNLLSAGPTSDGKFEIALQSKQFVVGVIAAHLADLLRSYDAKNYIEMDLTHPEMGPLAFTLQKKWGKTPSELYHEAKDTIIGLFDAAKKRYDDDDSLYDAIIGRNMATMIRNEAAKIGIELPSIDDPKEST